MFFLRMLGACISVQCLALRHRRIGMNIGVPRPLRSAPSLNVCCVAQVKAANQRPPTNTTTSLGLPRAALWAQMNNIEPPYLGVLLTFRRLIALHLLYFERADCEKGGEGSEEKSFRWSRNVCSPSSDCVRLSICLSVCV